MPYSNFSFKQVKQKFDLETVEVQSFIPDALPEVVLNSAIAELLQDNIQLGTIINTEKGRSEYIIAPILAEVRRQLKYKISLFSGQDLNVDAEQGLVGCCDFILSKSSEQFALEAPILVLVEAKKADLSTGMGQVVAEMVAAQIFNQEANNDIKTIYGCVTTGEIWRFLKLEGKQLTIQLKLVYLEPLEELIATVIKITA